jgi:uncharacterized protein (DUF1697 family)
MTHETDPLRARTTTERPVTDRRVALLRGVNVGTAKRIAMAELRKLVEALDYTDVRTLLNSGNVVFTAPKAVSGDAAARIEAAILARLGVSTRVTVLTGKEVADAVRSNPLAAVADDPARLLVMAFPDAKAMARLKPLLGQAWAPEVLALGTRFAYMWCARGIVKSRLWTAANRALGDVGTARNIATMGKLLALVEAPSSPSP